MVGDADGTKVGLVVSMHCFLSAGSDTKPSRQAQKHSAPAFTAIVELRSQPWLPSSQACSVGMFVGEIVGATLVGDEVGASVGASVGVVVGVALGLSVTFGAVVGAIRGNVGP